MEAMEGREVTKEVEEPAGQRVHQPLRAFRAALVVGPQLRVWCPSPLLALVYITCLRLPPQCVSYNLRVCFKLEFQSKLVMDAHWSQGSCSLSSTTTRASLSPVVLF